MRRSDRTWLEISGSALRHNAAQFSRLVGANHVAPVIKANAYGHGVREVTTALHKEKLWGRIVANGDEGLVLRRTLRYDGRILAVSSWEPAQVAELLRYRIELVAWDFPSLAVVLRTGRRLGRRPRLHLKLDTGTTRIGFLPGDVDQLCQVLQPYRATIAGVFSHFANAEEKDQKDAQAQLLRFATLERKLKHWGIAGERHIACTAPALRLPGSHYDLIRLGIGLYGLWPSESIQAWAARARPKLSLQPALQWLTTIQQVKNVPAGTAVGYGSTYRYKRAGRVAIIPIGYSDGYPRAASNTAQVTIGGRRAPVVGRVAMNLTMLDVTRVPQAKAGQLVELIGPQWSASDLATSCGTISYEIISRIPATLPRYLS